MIQVQHLFDGDDEEGYHNNRVHLGEMAGLLGHPPLDFSATASIPHECSTTKVSCSQCAG